MFENFDDDIGPDMNEDDLQNWEDEQVFQDGLEELGEDVFSDEE